MTDKERELIERLYIYDSISKEDFLISFTVNIVKSPEYLQTLFDCAITEKSGEDIDMLFSLGSIFGLFNKEHLPLFYTLLKEQWHYEHENIVFFLQFLKDPDSIESLYNTALTYYDYLEYNDCYALIRKCCFALGDINTPESKEKLRLLSLSDNEIIRDAALEQFEIER